MLKDWEVDVDRVRQEVDDLLQLVYTHGDEGQLPRPATLAVTTFRTLRHLSGMSSTYDLRLAAEGLEEIRGILDSNRSKFPVAGSLIEYCDRALAGLSG